MESQGLSKPLRIICYVIGAIIFVTGIYGFTIKFTSGLIFIFLSILPLSYPYVVKRQYLKKQRLEEKAKKS